MEVRRGAIFPAKTTAGDAGKNLKRKHSQANKKYHEIGALSFLWCSFRVKRDRLHFLEIFLFSSQSVSGPEGLRFSFKGHPVLSLEEACSDSRGCQVLVPGESLL